MNNDGEREEERAAMDAAFDKHNLSARMNGSERNFHDFESGWKACQTFLALRYKPCITDTDQAMKKALNEVPDFFAAQPPAADEVAARIKTVHRRIDSLCEAANTPGADYFDASTSMMIATRDLLIAFGYPHHMDSAAQPPAAEGAKICSCNAPEGTPHSEACQVTRAARAAFAESRESPFAAPASSAVQPVAEDAGDDWPTIECAAQDADGSIISATLKVGETVTRMVPCTKGAIIYQTKLKRAQDWRDCDKATFDYYVTRPDMADARIVYAAPASNAGSTEEWIDQNVSGNKTLIRAMKNIATRDAQTEFNPRGSCPNGVPCEIGCDKNEPCATQVGKEGEIDRVRAEGKADSLGGL